jgi:hypothetical protein
MQQKKKSEENNIYESSPEVNLASSTPASYTYSITHISESLISNQSTPTSRLSPAMANYDCDPFPHVHAGMVAIPLVLFALSVGMSSLVVTSPTLLTTGLSPH